LATAYQTDGTEYDTWKDRVTAALPVPASYPPTVAVDAQGIVTVTIRWLAPGEATTKPHQYITIAQIK
jgi:hypothetical protein